jgi:hypothetical protein
MPRSTSTTIFLPVAISIYKNTQWLHGRVVLIAPYIVLAMVCCVHMNRAPAQTKTATSATLSVTSGTGPATSVASGSVVTLKASVTAGGIAVTRGQVNFCDASAKFCTDIHILGIAQLTAAGTATIKLRPGVGSHSYKAVFLGTNTYANSSSSASALVVTGSTGTFPTTTTIGEERQFWKLHTLRNGD